MSRIEGCLNETSGWPRAKYRVSFLALQQAEEGNKHTQKSSTIQRNYFWRKKKLKDNSWWRTFLTNWGRNTLCLTTPLTCASVRGIISWVFLMFHCLKKSCAFLKYHLNQETGKKTWLNSRVSKIEEPTLILGLIKGDPCFSSFPSFKTHLFCNQFLMSMFSLRMSIGKKNHASMIAWARAFIAI